MTSMTFGRLFTIVGLLFLTVVGFSLYALPVHAEIAAPSNLSTNITGFKNINLTWSAQPEPSTGYVVYRDDIAVSTTTATNYTDPNITLPGMQHCYKVIAYDPTNAYSTPSSPICTAVSRGTAVPPIELTATIISSTAVELVWKYPVSPAQLHGIDLIGYTFWFFIERSNDGGSTWSIVGSKYIDLEEEASVFTVTYTDTRAQAGGGNMYRVTAFDGEGDGFSLPSNTATAETPRTETVPQAPSNLTVSYSGMVTSATLGWADNSNDETGFVIEKKSGDDWVETSSYNQPNTGASFSQTLSNLSYGTTYIVRVRAKNSVGLSLPSNTTNIVIPPAPNLSGAASNVVCIYNATLPISKDICDYYVQKRPGAQSTAIDIPDSAFYTQADFHQGKLRREEMTEANFNQYVLQPIMAYVASWSSNFPSNPLTYIALAKGVPIRVCKTPPHCSLEAAANQILNNNLRGNGISVSYLTAFTLEDAKKMIDKAQAATPDLSTVKWMLDLDGNGHRLGDSETLGAKVSLISLGVPEQNVILDTSNVNPLVIGTPIVAYGGLGTHHNQSAQASAGVSPPYGYPRDWTYRSLDMPVANRAVIDIHESFYALSFDDHLEVQGLLGQAMSPTAFNGSNYSRSFSGGVGTVFEPSTGTVSFQTFFAEYMKGHTLAQAFRNAAPPDQYPMAMVVGDPLMTIRDGGGLLSPIVNVKPTIDAGADRVISDRTTQLMGDVLNRGIPNLASSVSWSKQSGPGTVTFVKQSSSYAGDTSPASTRVTFPADGVYVLRLTVSNGPLSAYDDVEIRVGSGVSDTLAPVIQSSSPSGTLPASTVSQVLSVTTNEPATCKYSTTVGVAFSSSGNTIFSTTGGTTHSVTLNNLSAGTSYQYYVRCQDTLQNSMTADYPVLFSVAARVSETDTTKPIVSIGFPLSNSIVYEGDVTLMANASDVGEIAGVSFYLNGAKSGSEDTVAPYSRTVILSVGSHTVYAVARDTAGNTATSPRVNFTVVKKQLQVPQPPSLISIDTPPGSKPLARTDTLSRDTYEMSDLQPTEIEASLDIDQGSQESAGFVSSIVSFVSNIVSGVVDFIVGIFN